MKVLYGQAYRAPSLTELYQNSPIETSNRNLQPEEVETIELVFGKDFGSKTQTTLTYFHNTINNVIRGVLQPGPGTLQRVNEGRVTIHGMEWELTTTLTEKLKIIANYTHIFSGMSDDAFQDSATLNASYKTGKWRFNINAIARNEMARVLPDQGSFYLLNARPNVLNLHVNNPWHEVCCLSWHPNTGGSAGPGGAGNNELTGW